MRISDWSSDVCSSDLVEKFPFERLGAEPIRTLRKFARHGDPPHHARQVEMGVIDWSRVGDGLIVPHYQRVGLPAEAKLIFAARHFISQQTADRFAFVLAQSGADSGGARVYKQDLLAGLRMDEPPRMHRW